MVPLALYIKFNQVLIIRSIKVSLRLYLHCGHRFRDTPASCVYVNTINMLPNNLNVSLHSSTMKKIIIAKRIFWSIRTIISLAQLEFKIYFKKWIAVTNELLWNIVDWTIFLILVERSRKGIFSDNFACWLLKNINERNFPLLNKNFRITMKNLRREKRSKLRRTSGRDNAQEVFQPDHEGYKVLYDTMEQFFTRLSNSSRSIWLVWKFRIESGISSLSYLSRAPDLRIEVRFWLSGTKNLPYSKKKRNN